ncbi:cytochrome-c peroxidase [Vibrio pacinii]|uniref:cytochrome-c peroxidase n=1 Tax=Vibrio pacinii TaxID=170674 RepID=UPI00068CE36F|nr:cytochrome c peroxidase [Vibrio pacinii]
MRRIKRLCLYFCFTISLWCSWTVHAGNDDKDKVELGRYLFNDVRLSKLGNRSCALCHDPNHGWSNTFSKTPDIYDQTTTLNTPSLLNTARFSSYFQRTKGVTDLKSSIRKPLFATQPVEMGMTEQLLIQRLSEASNLYSPLFEQAFGSPNVTVDRALDALAKYVQQIVSTDTAYQRYLNGDETSLSFAQQQGRRLFFSQRLKCSQCHGGNLMNQPMARQPEFVNVGLYGINNSDGQITYPIDEVGLESQSGDRSDNGRFRIPSLINVVKTGPWGHDGSFQSLNAVIDSYAAGGRVIRSGNDIGDGRVHPNKDAKIAGFSISIIEKEALIAFLSALSVSDASVPANKQSPFCSLVPLKHRPDNLGCIPPFIYLNKD